MLASIVIFVLVITVFVMLLSGRFTAEYAAQRGRSRHAWFLVGSLFFPLFPIPWMILGLLPARSQEKAS